MAASAAVSGSTQRRPHLRREVGLVSLTFVSLGSIIGSGWLLGALTAATVAGPASLVSWVLAGFIIAMLALVHAELGAAYPMSGGTARFTHMAFGSIAGFTAGWMAWLQAVALAPVEIEAALSYLQNVSWAPSMIDSSGALNGVGLAISVGLMAVFTTINIMGVRWLAETNRVTVVWKFLIPVITVIALVATTFHGANFHAGGGFAPYGVHGIFAALPAGVVFALQGFEQALQVGGEARNPQKDLARAVITAMIIGVLLYLALEVAFIGSLDPTKLVHGWANPVGKGDFGPYATLATGLGLGWLATLLYIDAFISPAGTGLLYVGTSSRLSYGLGRNGYLPGAGLERIDRRGVPFVSIILAFVVGLLMLLPFPSWQSLVGIITDATFIMYGFAPVALGALRRADPDRERPYRLPIARVLCPAAFVAGNWVIYWSGWEANWKLMAAIAFGLILFAVSLNLRTSHERPPIDWRASAWVFPWLLGLFLISKLGQFGGTGLIPFWLDLILLAIWGVVIYEWAVRLTLPQRIVQEIIAREEDEAEEEERLAVPG
jgi:amino acid transporter